MAEIYRHSQGPQVMSTLSDKPTVLLHVDLDSLWAIKEVYGLPIEQRDETNDPLYQLGFARLLDLFDEMNMRATFFAIGRDCQIAEKAQLLKRAVQSGHEVANHSMQHNIAMGQWNLQRVTDDIQQASEAIYQACGQRPVGFRAPGFDLSPSSIQAAQNTGMIYDSSLLPTSTGGLLRAASSYFNRNQRQTGGGHYGRGATHRAPTSPYRPNLTAPWKAVESAADDSSTIWELPVAVSARCRLPLYHTITNVAGWTWTRCALQGLGKKSSVIVYLLHAIDMVGGEDLPQLPGGILGRRVFRMAYEKKRKNLLRVLDYFSNHCQIGLTREFVSETFLK